MFDKVNCEGTFEPKIRTGKVSEILFPGTFGIFFEALSRYHSEYRKTDAYILHVIATVLHNPYLAYHY